MCSKYVNDNEKIFSWLYIPFLCHPLPLLPCPHIRYSLLCLHTKWTWKIIRFICLFAVVCCFCWLFIWPFTWTTSLTGLTRKSSLYFLCIQQSMFNSSNSAINCYYCVCTRFYVLLKLNHPFIYSPLFFVGLFVRWCCSRNICTFDFSPFYSSSFAHTFQCICMHN